MDHETMLLTAIAALVGGLSTLFGLLQKSQGNVIADLVKRVDKLIIRNDECEEDRRTLWRYLANRDNEGNIEKLKKSVPEITAPLKLSPPSSSLSEQQ